MTEEQLKHLKLLGREESAEEKRFELAREEHKQRIRHLIVEKSAITNKCDHKYPNGKTSWSSHFMYGLCDICGMTDL